MLERKALWQVAKKSLLVAMPFPLLRPVQVKKTKNGSSLSSSFSEQEMYSRLGMCSVWTSMVTKRLQ